MSAGRRALAFVAIQLLLALAAAPCLCLHAAPATAATADVPSCHSHTGGAPAREPGPRSPSCPHCGDHGALVAVSKIDRDAPAAPGVPLLFAIGVRETWEPPPSPPPAPAASPCAPSGRSRLARHGVLRI